MMSDSTVAALVSLARQLELAPHDLDETVHVLADDYASTVNNRGLEGQLEFISKELGNASEKLRELHRELHEFAVEPVEGRPDLPVFFFRDPRERDFAMEWLNNRMSNNFERVRQYAVPAKSAVKLAFGYMEPGVPMWVGDLEAHVLNLPKEDTPAE